MDSSTIDRVTENLESTAERIGLHIEELIIFGSRVREDYRPESDVDILVVSPDFRGFRRTNAGSDSTGSGTTRPCRIRSSSV